MKPSKYRIYFNSMTSIDLAVVEVTDHAAAEPAMENMLLFWSNGDDLIEAENGDQVTAWLKMLGVFVLNHRRIPGKEDEGWAPLDGSYGIKVSEADPVEFDAQDVEIIEEGDV